jgi:MATE family multidrug resistance protein
MSLIFVIPIGYLTKFLNLIPSYYAEDGVVYQKILTYFCWLPALTAAFTGFFIGRGKTRIVTVVVVLGTLVNIVLDYFLVFGYGSLIPSLGCKGAAIATIVAEGMQTLILASGFWSKWSRKAYNTGKNSGFDKKLFLKCLKIGTPMAFGRGMEMLAWYLMLSAMSHVSRELATIQGIITTIYVLFAFVCDGLVKGSATLSANFIGQKNMPSIACVFRKLTIITIIICSVTMLPLLVAPGVVFNLLNMLNEDISALYPTIAIVFKMLFFEVTAEALCCVSWGILLSGGDSKYPIIANLSCIWGIVVVPVVILFAIGQLKSAVVVNSLCLMGNVASCIIVYRRYKSLKWYKSLID